MESFFVEPKVLSFLGKDHKTDARLVDEVLNIVVPLWKFIETTDKCYLEACGEMLVGLCGNIFLQIILITKLETKSRAHSDVARTCVLCCPGPGLYLHRW